MNWNYFNTLGYASVILWMAMPLLWFVHSRMKPRRWLVHIALLSGFVAYIFAQINSTRHVERIQLDQSEQLAQVQAEKEAKLQALLDSREEDVADIEFAEDDADDFYDTAGMDESELKYLDKVEEETDPGWKGDKKTRSAGGDDADLEDLIGAEEETEGVVSEELEKTQEAEPIIMSGKDMAMANRLDSLNQKTIRGLSLLGIILLVVDYLRRGNVYRESYLPLPLPGSWYNSMTPPAVIEERPAKPRRSMVGELAWFTRFGQTFLYLTDDPEKAGQLPDELPKFGKKRWKTELIRISDDGRELNEEFVFESLWYGRASFIVDSADSAKSVLDDLCQRLKKRKKARARVRRNVHVVWDLNEPVPQASKELFADLAESTGFILFINENQNSSHDAQ